MGNLLLPASISDYFSQRSIRTAVDQLLQNDDVPEDILWDDLRQLYEARLAAQQVMAEYAVFMSDVWNATWSVAFHDRIPAQRFSPVPISEYAAAGWPMPTSSRLWDEDVFQRAIVVDAAAEPTFIETAVSLSELDELQLQFAVCDEDWVPKVVRLPPDMTYWRDADENWYVTGTCAVSLRQRRENLDLSPLVEAAYSAIDASGV